MNFNCIICSDILQPTLEIYATSCGHIFHHICLIQWLERSKTCPQCRCKVTEKTIHRLYFNLTNTDGIADDVATLQAKMDSLHFQIRLKDKDIQNYKEKYEKSKDQSVALRSEVRTLESREATFESVIHALKEQVSFFKSRGKDVERLSDKVKYLKSKLQSLENVELVISGTAEQVRDMARYNRDPEALNLLVCTLKRELVESERKYRHQGVVLKQLQTDVSAYKKRAEDLTKENSKLSNIVEFHKNCEEEKQYYKEKLAELEAKMSSRTSLDSSPNTTVKRIITESPAPLTSQQRDFNNGGRSNKAQQSDSPFSLSIKSSNVGLSCLLSPKYVTSAPKLPHKNFSEYKWIHQNPDTGYRKFKTPRSDYSYDGLGGHCKDTKFPEPKSLAGVKRHKPPSASSAKQRKLAPNKKVTDFLDKKPNDVTFVIDD